MTDDRDQNTEFSPAAGRRNGQLYHQETLQIDIRDYWLWERFSTAINSVWHIPINEVSSKKSVNK